MRKEPGREVRVRFYDLWPFFQTEEIFLLGRKSLFEKKVFVAVIADQVVQHWIIEAGDLRSNPTSFLSFRQDKLIVRNSKVDVVILPLEYGLRANVF